MATETLRPNAAGDETAIGYQSPGTGAHWDKVDEAVADDFTSEVYEPDNTWVRDLYNLPAHSVGSGTINSVTIYMRALSTAKATARAKISLKTGGTTVDGATETFAADSTWYNFSKAWATNPVAGGAWTWAQIDALQIGASIRGLDGEYSCDVTQIYVVIDYTAGWSGTFNGLKTPASAVGVASASLASVVGVTG
jgi:hypothetical protein